jgi:predicted transcriptional regulator
MFSLLKLIIGDNNPPPALGRLEIQVMDYLWQQGEANVRGVIIGLGRQHAYTTVMTTMDRLFKKGMLKRRKDARAFLYAPQMSRPEWEYLRIANFVAGFLSVPQPSRDSLVSCLVDVVGEHDETLLDELEEKIKQRRKELEQQQTDS